MTPSKDDSPSKVVWTAESTHPQLIEKLTKELREVVDPEIGLDIIELGLVRNVEIADKEATITMILTTPFCPYGPAMLETTRHRAEKALNLKTRIEMGMEMWDPSMMEEGAGADWGMF